ncbi:MAG: 16S rRNA (guanine(966)-N(2))-methyltransferase RsmD [Gammaproteobacteria bacterium]
MKKRSDRGRGINPEKSPGRIRIIGGQWRSRQLPVPDRPGLRPTPDRLREALFNWLQDCIQGARCLDLFAGSGALGFEAASRGAAGVVLVERDPALVHTLEEQVSVLQAAQMQVRCSDALRWLNQPQDPFDIIFLDPPFGTDLLPQCLDLIASNAMLRTGGRVYVETSLNDVPPETDQWMQIKQTRAGQVRAVLLQMPEGV